MTSVANEPVVKILQTIFEELIFTADHTRVAVQT